MNKTEQLISEEIQNRIDKWVQSKNELVNSGVGLTHYGIDCRISELKDLLELIKR